MTLQQPNYVIAIAETGSYNKAAERLFIAQPSLTSAIKELEKELKIILFNHGGRGTSLTAEGRDFLPYARSVIAQYQAILDQYGDQGPRKQHPLEGQSAISFEDLRPYLCLSFEQIHEIGVEWQRWVCAL